MLHVFIGVVIAAPYCSTCGAVFRNEMLIFWCSDAATAAFIVVVLEFLLKLYGVHACACVETDGSKRTLCVCVHVGVYACSRVCGLCVFVSVYRCVSERVFFWESARDAGLQTLPAPGVPQSLVLKAPACSKALLSGFLFWQGFSIVS